MDELNEFLDLMKIAPPDVQRIALTILKQQGQLPELPATQQPTI